MIAVDQVKFNDVIIALPGDYRLSIVQHVSVTTGRDIGYSHKGSTAEVAAWDKEGNFVLVEGWVNAARLAEIIAGFVP